MANLELIANDYLPLRDVVYQTLRNAILKGDLKPGERLMEMKLASKLGVSRTPIREAIRLLEKDGLAITIPRHGAMVAKMTEKDMEDVYEVRHALDCLAMKYVCGNMSHEQIAELRYAEKVFEEAIADGDDDKIQQKDAEFHSVLYEATGNTRLVSITSEISEQLARYRWAYVLHAERVEALVKEHKAIVDAIEHGDYDECIAALNIHLENQKKLIKDVIKSGK
ncbi:MAG: GntR family transcriptional regulator [Lachnospiraceae bacterium]|jgi:DNA-binding GntR family transcriptional regulator|nr:GntR family transcriptional regulator [Lachnospiraceae bacterium]MBQ9342017.1 GntR family transcriptional regulator [Lachnospiraceae bacterium]